ncbi:hypothetical protein A2348_05515 [Candidatus Uhrbacteria bacterium RIFOXYB12_FULL_58_10]|uniref:DUF5671 domain-containing protein n=1 Tax=Candidatus Uhrbacteria bacterium RIFOXYB2_FULL_57_15 TaxID=1802422 RepID=A0A1F7W7V9_9BACT|nr:MAG: hypothetical protein A2348_05515 [Candidatus Uhrbacteria bacterium RIFOXYB12_FULL_58_10]OGL98882.1 MAG: hypothetical protein A2304_03980 [Candidatus Uhrbacteria bacterium RIFOXYB2_FULL_57_15]OGM00339.1 MAG: hypothetical protein A2501_02090 [Candidatus Uhrbacteria bacterium RIFOXYC12_FULL_57_11]
MTKGGSIILRIYFTLVAFVTLMILIFSVSDLVNIALKTYVFPKADRPEYTMVCDLQYQTREQCDTQKVNDEESARVRKQQSAVRDISLLLVAAPLFWLHWRVVYRDLMGEREEKKEEKKS